MEKKNNGWALAFSIGATAFAAHAGGGFATGNQANTFFVSLGWVSIFSCILAMVLLALSLREAQIMWNTRHLNSYKELFSCLFHPYDQIAYVFDIFYDIMILMVVASCIAGAAGALKQYIGFNYTLSAIAVGIIILLLSIFGAELVRKSSTYMGTVILVLSLTVYLIGIVKGENLFGKMSIAFANEGMSNVVTGILNGFKYAGFQWVTLPAVLACGTILRTRQNCTRGMICMLVFNVLGLGMSVLMLFCWQDYFTAVEGGTTIPTLTSLQAMDMGWLVFVYVVILFLCLISSGVAVVFGFINRFEHAYFLQKIENVQVRRSLLAVFIIVVSMGISFFGLTNVVKYGYGYCGYIGIVVAVVPLITLGHVKNKRWLQLHTADGNSFDDAPAENK